MSCRFVPAFAALVSAPALFAANPVFDGWYADPDCAVFENRYWIYPTTSEPYHLQTFFDAFSSSDLVTWTKHTRVLTAEHVSWAKRAMWAPAVVANNGKYYFFFAANDVHQGETGGIGVAVSDRPDGPFKDLLGRPLVNYIVNGAQPIDQFVFRDDDGQWYMYYGGWGHCNLVRLADDFKSLVPFADGTVHKEITPEGYTEGPFLFKRNGKYYFMWSEGGWTTPDYFVAYAVANSPLGPFRREGRILTQNPAIGTGAGHHSVLRRPGSDDWFIVYHRHPAGDGDGNHREICIDRLTFDADGKIEAVTITREGVAPQPLAKVPPVWENLPVARIDFTDQAPTTVGSAYYRGQITNPEAYIQDHIRQVLAALYFSPTDATIPKISRLRYELETFDGVSAKSGGGDDTKIVFSTSYIERIKGGGRAAFLQECGGVLLHELAHAYQLEPQGIGSYGSNPVFTAFIEGMADAVRVACGGFTLNDRIPGGRFDEGYRRTGFFFDWIRRNKDADFIRKMNASTRHVVPWSWQGAFDYALGKGTDIAALWNEYSRLDDRVFAEKAVWLDGQKASAVVQGRTVLRAEIAAGDVRDAEHRLRVDGGEIAAEADGVLYLGGQDARMELDIARGRVTAPVSVWSAGEPQLRRVVQVRKGGVFAPARLFSPNGEEHDARRLLVRLAGGEFVLPAAVPKWTAIETAKGVSRLTLGSSAAIVRGTVSVPARSRLRVETKGGAVVFMGGVTGDGTLDIVGGTVKFAPSAKREDFAGKVNLLDGAKEEAFVFGRPLREYSRDPAFISAFRAGTLAIAERKLREVEEGRHRHPSQKPLGPRLSTGGGFSGFFVWDSVFSVMWARHFPDRFPIHSTLDNFYAMQTPDGFICREFTVDGVPCWSPAHPISWNPPILAWAEVQLYRDGLSDRKRLEKVYPHLRDFHACCRKRFRRADGLYFGDALGCGMDDLPRWPRENDLPAARRSEGGIELTRDCTGPTSGHFWDGGWLPGVKASHCWNRQGGWVDMSAQMAFDALNLAEIADAIGKKADARAYRAEHAEIAKAVNRFCWDETRGFYFDCWKEGVIERYTVAAFWTLVARIPSRAQAKRLVEKLLDPAYFGRPVPVPALAACDPQYDPENGYWCGSVWPPTTYITIMGLRAAGFEKEAELIARRWYDANAELFVRTGTVFENISPEQCDHPKARSAGDFTGWAALPALALPAEFGWE